MRLSIVTKILLLFIAVIALFAAVTYYQISQSRWSRQALREINVGYLPLTKIMTQIDAAHKTQQADVSRMLELDDSHARGVLTRLILEYFPKVIRKEVASGVAHCDKMRLVTGSDEDRAFYGRTQEGLEKIASLQAKYRELAQSMISLLEDAETDGKQAMAKLGTAERSLNRAIKVLSLQVDDGVSKAVGRVERKGEKTTWAGIIMSVAVSIAAILLALTSGFLLKPLRRLTEAAQKIGQGEYRYSVSIRSGDELGTLAEEFERMRRSLLARDKALTRQADELESSNVKHESMKLHYENIINNLTLPVLVADVRLRLTTVNPAARRIWGEDLERWTGKKIHDLPLGQRTLGEVFDLEAVMHTKARQVREAIEIEGKNAVRRVTVSAVPFFEASVVKGLLLLCEDVTDAIRMKDSLLLSERMAAIGRIASKITHEVRNPLSSISLNTEMLQEELESGNADSDDLRPLLTSIIKEIDRLHGITENYLNFARQPETKSRRIDLNDIAASLGEFYQAEMIRRDIVCRIELAENKLMVFADENQMIQVLHNLIRNAMEAMQKGGTLSLATESDEENHILHVIDDGPGIPKEVVEKIFEPFFSTKRQGTGLGLALARQTLVRFGGELRYRPVEDHGAHFSISLPMIDNETSQYV